MLSKNDKRIMETTETRKCKRCGRELPVTEFTKHAKYGTMKICRECNSKARRAGKHKVDPRELRLKDFEPRELMLELKRRGYSFTATYTKTYTIDSDKLE